MGLSVFSRSINMKKNLNVFFITVSLLLILTCCSESVSEETTGLWPNIEPYLTDYLQVSDLHEIYYEACGNPEGIPVFVLHGGPGARISPYYRRFFNPEVFHTILHDQRGTGLSRPFLELRENTTWDLVEDIEKLRKHMECEQIILFGGSWGSTLALAYAETYPENVSGLVIRGIFTATQEELDHYYSSGVKVFFPEAYARLEEVFGQPLSPDKLFSLIQEKDSEDRFDFSKAWTAYEAKIAELNISDPEVRGMVNSPQIADIVRSLALLENYYMANGCFFEEGQLFTDADRIKDIPAVLVNGRYDMICPPTTAYRLHQKLPLSQLVIVEEAGHSMSEPGIEQALLRAMKTFEKN